MKVIFTGISGIKLWDSLNKFQIEVQAANKSTKGKVPVLLKVEDEMIGIHKGYCEEGCSSIDDSSKIFQHILILPQPQLKRLWREAFQSAIDKSSTAKDVWFLMHLCFYHQETREYVSLIDFELLQNFKPDFVITLIDDIYDIHDRLREPGQIFHPISGGGSEIIPAILDLFRVVDWRSKETMLARLLADNLGCPHFLLAVKHPLQTLLTKTQLVFTQKMAFALQKP